MTDTFDRRLWSWSLGAFHAGLLVLLLVLAVYRLGDLGGALKNGGTLPGIALYLALWASTWWTATRALAGDEIPSPGTALRRGALWGGVNGVIFLTLLLLGIFLSAAARHPVSINALTAIPVALLEAALGAIPAFAVGALIGTVFALLDTALLGAAHALLPERQWKR